MLRLNIEKETIKNKQYRKIIYTDKNIQLVLMNLYPGEEIEKETHVGSQFIRVEEGFGWATVGDKKFILKDGVSITIPPNTEHYVKSTQGLKLYTIYSPPEHDI